MAVLLFPSAAPAADTKIERMGEAVGAAVSEGSGRRRIENLDYSRKAEVRHVTSSRFEFRRVNGGTVFGFVRRGRVPRLPPRPAPARRGRAPRGGRLDAAQATR